MGHIDLVWQITCCALVLLMQIGFCCLESGSVGSRNSINVAAKNFADICVCSLIFWAVGFGVMFGQSLGGLFGTSEFFFAASTENNGSIFFLYQLLFCGTVATIVSGAAAERMSFNAYLIATVVIAALIYPVVGHWIWGAVVESNGTGWLKNLGFHDFAGSTVVHATGGWIALAVVLIIGPRTGRFQKTSSVQEIQNFPLVSVGTMLLWIGWIGFNGGSVFALDNTVPRIVLNTFLAGATAGSTILILMTFVPKSKVNVFDLLNGSLAGLVSITGSADWASPPAAIILGSIGALMYLAASRLLEKMQIDDVVGAIPVHLSAGIWGTLAAAFIAPAEYLQAHGGLFVLLFVQIAGVVTVGAWAFGLSFGCLTVLNHFLPIRVSVADERRGLNVAEHGIASEFQMLSEYLEEEEERQKVLLGEVEFDPNSEIGQIAKKYSYAVRKFRSVLDKERGKLAQSEVTTGLLRTRTADLEKALLDKEAALVRSSNRNKEVLVHIDLLSKVLDHDSEQRRLFFEQFSNVLSRPLKEISAISSKCKASNYDVKALRILYERVEKINSSLNIDIRTCFNFLSSMERSSPHSEQKFSIDNQINHSLDIFKQRIIKKNCAIDLKLGKIPQIFANKKQFEDLFCHILHYILDEVLSDGKILIATVFDKKTGFIIKFEVEGLYISVNNSDEDANSRADFHNSFLDMSIGLGLAKRLVELHEGHMRIDLSDDGKTLFLIKLPSKRAIFDDSPASEKKAS